MEQVWTKAIQTQKEKALDTRPLAFKIYNTTSLLVVLNKNLIYKFILSVYNKRKSEIKNLSKNP
ncbi:hypothetical protein BpHYR1_037462 [Brachionus plicatilis]|uniref:Uncharacterized protein n=1 Tax=Brachionus plicatilis TaxID=10195 RepID=A0A3M7S6F2_BRAPC|nr:hypothetical protein BpHYR1_037462 [Brachionus plicatilis]